MAIYNISKKEIECKLVYYGPGRGGKTTNLDYLYKTQKKYIKGQMTSINTEGDRTLFFDFLPMDFGKIKGCNIRVQLYTVPGQVQYARTRKLVLIGVDGVVFVADSLEERRKENMESLKDLQLNLREYGKNIFKIPLVMQFNKRDLANEGLPVMPMDMMERDLNRQLKVPVFPGSAITGEGVKECLSKCLVLTIASLKESLPK
jgi:mutual gliding-motility protein MglA